MKRTALATTLILTICASIVAETLIAEVGNANFLPPDYLSINSPISKKVYATTSIPLKIIAYREVSNPEIVSITYRLDENPNVTLTDLQKSLGKRLLAQSRFWAETVLNNLSEGNHTLKAYSTDALGEHMDTFVDFVIDTSYTSPAPIASPSPSPDPTPTPPEGSSYSIPAFVIGPVIVIAAGIGALLYFKKRKHEKSHTFLGKGA